MHALLIAVSIATTPAGSSAVVSPGEALASQVQTGTILLSEGDCLAVKVFTRSPYTHVAAVVVEDDEPVVYDSQNGVGVRKLSLAEYLVATRPNDLHVLHPARRLDGEREEAFRSHLESQIGRPYAIRHHLTGQRSEGLHCAEYVTDALMAAKIVKAENPSRVSPASLRAALLKHDLYTAAGTVPRAVPPFEEETADSGWCRELWDDTKDCCATCWMGFRRRILCR